MIVVKNAEIVEVARDDYWPIGYFPRRVPDMQGPGIDESIGIKIEYVEGRFFRNAQGLEVVIGWDKETQLALGLPFKVFENMNKRRESDYFENMKLRKKIREMEEMSIFQFIRFKFARIFWW